MSAYKLVVSLFIGGLLTGSQAKATPILRGNAGTIRSVSTSQTWHERVLYSFVAGGAYGAYPYAGVIEDSAGALYGTTSGGGAYSAGTVFKLTPSGSSYVFRLLYSFRHGTDGAIPHGGLLIDTHGALYGTTVVGGSYDLGTVFKLTPVGSGYTEQILHAFAGGLYDGENPRAGLVADKNGALYGTTGFDGAFGYCPPGTDCGTVFKLSPSGSGYRESVLHMFEGGADGADLYDRLVMHKAGVLYGATLGGGNGSAGTIFKLNQLGTSSIEIALHSFPAGSDGIDGVFPYTSVTLGANGVIFGTTSQGGAFYSGTVFMLQNSGTTYREDVLYSFRGGSDGAGPYTNVVANRQGVLFGATEGGGATAACPSACGTIFSLAPSPAGAQETVIYRFQGGINDGAAPIGELIADKNGTLYGSTLIGGPDNLGTVFAIAH
jgi:uncharacterized repeat protein (TIGR03803 family)